MSTVVEYSKRKKELDYINKVINTYIAKHFESDWNINIFYSLKDFASYIGTTDFVDFLCIDVCENIALSLTELIREKNKNAVILILADTGVSPALYMKPSIMAASLLLFPLDKAQVVSTIDEIFKYISNAEESDRDSFFVIKSKSEHEHIPNSKIMYFESKEKKLFLNTEKREYGFYSNIETVMEQLPDYFIRCHRSFVINSRKIKKVMLSQNTVELEGGITIPLSKSYKPILKEYRNHAGI